MPEAAPAREAVAAKAKGMVGGANSAHALSVCGEALMPGKWDQPASAGCAARGKASGGEALVAAAVIAQAGGEMPAGVGAVIE